MAILSAKEIRNKFKCLKKEIEALSSNGGQVVSTDLTDSVFTVLVDGVPVGSVNICDVMAANCPETPTSLTTELDTTTDPAKPELIITHTNENGVQPPIKVDMTFFLDYLSSDASNILAYDANGKILLTCQTIAGCITLQPATGSTISVVETTPGVWEIDNNNPLDSDTVLRGRVDTPNSQICFDLVNSITNMVITSDVFCFPTPTGHSIVLGGSTATVDVTVTPTVAPDGVITYTVTAETKTELSSDSVTPTTPISYRDITFEGENDLSDTGDSISTETVGISDKVFVEATSTVPGVANIKVTRESYTTQTRVSGRFGNDATGIVNREDRPFATLTAAKAAMDAAGLLAAPNVINPYSMKVESGIYTEGNIAGVTSGKTLIIHTEGLPTIDITFYINGGTLFINGEAIWLNTPANSSSASSQFSTNGGNIIVSGGAVFRNFKKGWNFVGTNGSNMQINCEYLLGGVASQDSVTRVVVGTADANLPDELGFNGLFKVNTSLSTESTLRIESSGKLYNGQPENTSSMGTGKGGLVFSAAQGGVLSASFLLATSENTPAAEASTNDINLISELRLFQGKITSNSSTYPTITTTLSDVTQTSRVIIYGAVSIHNSNYGFSIGSPTIGSEFYMYNIVQTDMPPEAGTNIVTGTLFVDAATL